MIQYLLALSAGVATALSPCILPMLPFLLGASAARPGANGRAMRYRPVFIVMGFVLSFATAALLFGSATHVLGLSQEALRTVASIVMLVCGVMLMWPSLLERAMAPLGGLADLAHRLGSKTGSSHVGGFLLGMSLGLLWAPCAGPVLASVLALIATEQQAPHAFGMLLAYALGAGLPMLLIAYGSQAVTARGQALAGSAGTIRRVFGALVVCTAVAMQWGGDVAAAAWVTRQVASDPSGSTPASDAPLLAQNGDAAPEFVGIDKWFNTAPLSLAQLRGKVVLVDFWTFACSNCINTLPALKRWHSLYKDQGLVVVGVHTPEFAFERDAANVQAAIQRFGITYAVAQDNRYRTWTAWQNAYWPAQYLIDKSGRVVFSHVGEGDEAQIEAHIKAALQAQAK